MLQPVNKSEWVCLEHAPVDFTDNDIAFAVTAAKRMEALFKHHHGITKSLYHMIENAGLASEMKEACHEFRNKRNSLVHDEDYNNYKFEDEERKEVNTRCMEIFLTLDSDCSCKFNDERRHFKLNINLPDVTMFFLTAVKDVFTYALLREIKRMSELRVGSRPWVGAWLKPLLGYSIGWGTGECLIEWEFLNELMATRIRRSILLEDIVKLWLEYLEEMVEKRSESLQEIVEMWSDSLQSMIRRKTKLLEYIKMYWSELSQEVETWCSLQDFERIETPNLLLYKGKQFFHSLDSDIGMWWPFQVMEKTAGRYLLINSRDACIDSQNFYKLSESLQKLRSSYGEEESLSTDFKILNPEAVWWIRLYRIYLKPILSDFGPPIMALWA